MKVLIKSEEEMINLGYHLKKLYYPNLVICLTGDLGAGKTTFTKGIGKALDIKRIINSPTFTIMKVYNETNHLNNIEALYHLDVYRLNGAGSDFVLEEYFYQNGLSVVEWAQNTKDLIPTNHWELDITIDKDFNRIVDIKFFDNTSYDELKEILEGANYEIID